MLNFITGAAGSGKSTYAVEMLCRETEKNPGKRFFLFVPEQNTLKAQQQIIKTSKNHGMLDLDVLSFKQLAYRVFDELGIDTPVVLDELSRSVLIRKAAIEVQKDLKIYKKKIDTDGFIRQTDKLISEFCQYDIDIEKLKDIEEKAVGNILKAKLSDIAAIYGRFLELMGECEAVPEEVPVILSKYIKQSHFLDDSVIVFDGFTGFTPIQEKIIGEILTSAENCYFTVTIPENVKNRTAKPSVYSDIFDLSRDTMADLIDIAAKNHVSFGKDIIIPSERKKPQALIKEAEDPATEVRMLTKAIRGFVSSEGEDFVPYSKIAVAVADLESYRTLISREFEKNGIPFFMDKKADAFKCAYVSLIRNVISLIVNGYKRDDCISLLRNPLFAENEKLREAADIADNVLRENGIHGRKRLSEFFYLNDASESTSEQTGQSIEQEILYEEKENEVYGQNKSNSELKFKVLGQKDTFAEIKTRFMEVFSLHDGLKEAGTVCEKIDALKAYLDLVGADDRNEAFMERLEKAEFFAEAEENRAIAEKTAELFERLRTVLGTEKVSIKDFSRLLDAGFSDLKAGVIPKTMEMVTVGDIKRSRFDDTEVLFVIGAVDGVLPQTTVGGGLFTDRERIRMHEAGLSMAPDDKTSGCIERFYFHLLRNKPEKLFCVSFPDESNEGKPSKPSEIITQMAEDEEIAVTKQKKEKLAAVTSETAALELFSEMTENGLQNDEEYKVLYRFLTQRESTKERAENILKAAFISYEPESISKETAKKLYSDKYKGSVSKIETYGRCPYRHFLGYGLSLSERKEYDIENSDIGTLYHKCIDEVFRELSAQGKKIDALSEEELEQITKTVVERVTASYNNSIIASSESNKYIGRKVFDVTNKTLKMVRIFQAESDFETIGTEVSFNAESDKMVLTGKIDRLDVRDAENEKMVKVIDYKSSDKKFDESLLRGGIQLQLGTYLDNAVKRIKDEMGVNAAAYGMYYFGIKEPIIKYERRMSVDEINKSLKKAMEPNGVSLEKISRDKLEEMLSSIRETENKSAEAILSGDIKVEPFAYGHEKGCDYCPYSSVCGFDKKIKGYKYRNIKKL